MSRSFLLNVVVVLAASTSACSRHDAVTGPLTLAEQIRGSWSESKLYPGISTVLELSVADTTITGTGTYTVEAGRPGTIVVTGTITAGKTVDLDLVRTDGWIGHFRGTLTSHDSLTGYSWGRSSFGIADPAPDSYHRIVSP